ncbi:MAG: ABC transporter ATP-binding protein [Albidovulum sp.]|nr:ABC transporter ATP-binding protein [Albidovulum sp.]
MSESEAPLLQIRDLSKTFERRYLVQQSNFSLRSIDLELFDGEVVGILGESGSGKSTLANIITRLTPYRDGEIFYRGKEIRSHSPSEIFKYKSEVQIVFQDPYGSLNPRSTIRNSIKEGLRLHQSHLSRQDMDARVEELLKSVGLVSENPEKFPHEFSGGQRQRIAIARAIAVQPTLLICDEPLSSLDVSIQAQIIELFASLIEEYRLTMLFISHDINVVRLLCDRVYVMSDGRIVEYGKTSEILNNPKNDYTVKLIESVF